MKLESSRLLLKPIGKKDLEVLHGWRNEDEFLRLCSNRRKPVGFEEFVDELNRDFDNDRHMQCVLLLKSSEEPVGTIYSYNLNLVDGYVFLTVYVSEECVGKGYGVEAVAILASHYFEAYPIHKLYMDVYGYNKHSLSTIERAGFGEEGRFKEHRFIGGQRYDLVRFAFYRNDLERLSGLIEKLKG